MDTTGKEGEETKAAIPVAVETKSPEILLDIEHEILLRLPVKCLLRFKSVCKAWRSIISDPKFTKSHHMIKHTNYHKVSFVHLSIDQEDEEASSEQGPCIYMESWPRVSFTSIVNSDEEASSEIKKLEIYHPFNYSSRFHNVVLGSSNGLLLVSSNNQTLLWNPTTGECMKTLPRRKFKYIDYVSGLGYDSALDEYKAVICFVCGEKSHLFIFTSTTGYWREVVGDDHDHLQWSIHDFSNCLGLTVNGSPHWLVETESNTTIVYFDMVEEKFKQLPAPTMPWWNDRYVSLEMSVMEGCLYIVYNNKRDDLFEFWAMKEYGVTDSWTKLFVIRRHQTWRLTPLGYTNNGDEVVLHINEGYLVTYNLKTFEDRGRKDPIPHKKQIQHQCGCCICGEFGFTLV